MIQRFEELLQYALLHKSTDIHFEISKDSNRNVEISFRTINGFKSIKSNINDLKVVEHIKYISNLNLVDITTPQSGSFKYYLNDMQYYFRSAIINSPFIEVCVLRILNKNYISENIFNEIKGEIDILLKQEYGLIIFSGPTGSGKTTSMYTLMQMYKDKKIYCIEDPVEIYFDNIVQISVNKERNLSYKNAISHVLRHDPDIICIGEIRDETAAHMAIRAAFTGHLVLCTIHASNAKSTIKRLEDLGVLKSDIQENLLMVLNQRLVVNDKNERESKYETLIKANL